MKKNILGIFMCVSLLSFAQNTSDAKPKDVLPNKITETQKTSAKKFFVPQLSKDFGNQGMVNTDPQVIIKILDPGFYTVQLNDEYIGSPYGMFRFFEVFDNEVNVDIYKDGVWLYSSAVDTSDFQKLVLEFSQTFGLYINKALSIPAYSICNLPVIVAPFPMKGMSSADFSDFLEAYSSQSFDENKLKFLQSVDKNIGFSSAQIIKLLKPLSFQDNKVIAAKMLYPYCVDRASYYKVIETLSFPSDREKMYNFIRNYH